jgi:hypothetical protein
MLAEVTNVRDFNVDLDAGTNTTESSVVGLVGENVVELVNVDVSVEDNPTSKVVVTSTNDATT